MKTPSSVAKAASTRLVTARPATEWPKLILKSSAEAPNMMTIWRMFIRNGLVFEEDSRNSSSVG
jgi:hypothetical protein